MCGLMGNSTALVVYLLSEGGKWSVFCRPGQQGLVGWLLVVTLMFYFLPHQAIMTFPHECTPYV